MTAVLEISIFGLLHCQADGTFERRSKRKRLGSASRSAAKIQKIEATVTQRPDVMRAKFLSKVWDVIHRTSKTYQLNFIVSTGWSST